MQRMPRTGARVNAPVGNYEGLAATCFIRLAGAAFRAIVQHGLREDWSSEIKLAALEAQRQGLLSWDAMHWFDRAARRALKAMGFYRERNAKGSIGGFLWRGWRPLDEAG
jgi:hypothetical protein